jgi:hypothetical protein
MKSGQTLTKNRRAKNFAPYPSNTLLVLRLMFGADVEAKSRTVVGFTDHFEEIAW